MSESLAQGGFSPLGWLGRATLRPLIYLIDLTLFTLQALAHGIRPDRRLSRRAPYSTLVSQLLFTGIDALPLIGVFGIATGLVITLPLMEMAHLFSDQGEVVTLLVNLVALQLGSLLTAFVLVSRSGSAIAVDLGGMRLRRELLALELLGVDIIALLVGPRLLGAVLAQLALAVYFTLIAIVAGVGFSALLYGLDELRYLYQIPLAFNPWDLLVFLLKNLLFGLAIGATACFHGLRVGRSPTELPQQTQQAIVRGLLLVFLVDGAFVLLGH